jgi:sirohydrochlorin ferrochelatase
LKHNERQGSDDPEAPDCATRSMDLSCRPRPRLASLPGRSLPPDLGQAYNRWSDLLHVASPLSHPHTAVLLIAHGSRETAANDDLRDLAARLLASTTWPIVEASFLELAQPDILTGGEKCVSRGATRVLLIPYFLAAGVHQRRDLTSARDELARKHPGVEFRLGAPLGPHPLLDELVATRIREVESG